jgi:hypothetical protein
VARDIGAIDDNSFLTTDHLLLKFAGFERVLLHEQVCVTALIVHVYAFASVNHTRAGAALYAAVHGAAA